MAGASASVLDYENKGHPRLVEQRARRTGLEVFLGLPKAILDCVSPGCFCRTENHNSILFTPLLLGVVPLRAMESSAH